MPLPLSAIVNDPDWKSLSPEDQAELRLRHAKEVAEASKNRGAVGKAVDTAIDFAGGVAKRLAPFPGLIDTLAGKPVPQVERANSRVNQPVQFGFPPQVSGIEPHPFERPAPPPPTGGTPNILSTEPAKGVQAQYPTSYIENAPRQPEMMADLGYLFNPIPSGLQQGYSDLRDKISQYTSPETAKLLMEDIPMGAATMPQASLSAGLQGIRNLRLYGRRPPFSGFATARDVTPRPEAPPGIAPTPLGLPGPQGPTPTPETPTPQAPMPPEVPQPGVPPGLMGGQPAVGYPPAIAKGKARVKAKAPAPVVGQEGQWGEPATFGDLRPKVEPPVLAAPEVVDKIEQAQDPEHFDKPAITKDVGEDTYVKTDVPVDQLETRPGTPTGLSAPDKGAIVAGEDGKVIDGNHRVEDAKMSGEPTVPAYVPVTSDLAPIPHNEVLQSVLDSYVKPIRNKDKRLYAGIYLNWIAEGRQGNPPDTDKFKLGTMAAQATRLAIEKAISERMTATVAPGTTIPPPAIPEAGAKPERFMTQGGELVPQPDWSIWERAGYTQGPFTVVKKVEPAPDISMTKTPEQPPIDITPETPQITPQEEPSGQTRQDTNELADGQRAGEDTGIIPSGENVGPGGHPGEGHPASGPIHEAPDVSGGVPAGGGELGGGVDLGPSISGQPGIPGGQPAPTNISPTPAEDIGQAGSGGGGDIAELAQEGGQPPSQELAPEAGLIPIEIPDLNYSLPKDQDWLPHSLKARVDANVKAVDILNELEKLGRRPSPEEQDALSKYVGWGGLKPVFDSGKAAYRESPPRYDFQRGEWQNWEKAWGKQYDKVKAGLSPEEYRSAKQSLDTQHYTSRVVINGIWAAIQRLGFQGGNALEPAVGVGNFIGLTPDALTNTTRWRGIDVDSVAARIARVLYPQAKIDISPYEKAKIPPNSQDLVVSNVPFSDITVADDRFPNLNLHNYYFVRSLDAVKPGGIVAFITSSYTMDAPSSVKVRQQIAEKADLFGAIRLPNDAFEKNANTEVTTDVIFLRKKSEGAFPGHRWDNVAETETYNKKPIKINEYYVEHPDMMLGRMSLEGTQYEKDMPALIPTPGLSLETQLAQAVQKLPQDVFGGQELTPINLPGGEAPGEVRGKPGTYVVSGNTIVKIGSEGQPLTPVWPTTPQNVRQAAGFIALRILRNRQVDMEVDPEATDEQVESSRKELAKEYDTYVKKYGFINGLKSKFLQDDIDFVNAGSLETPVYSFRTTAGGKQHRQTNWIKSDILTKRTGYPRVAPSSVDNIPDAAEVSFNFKGKADPEYIAQLTKAPVETVVQTLEQSGIAFQDPKDGLWYSGPEYLSGFVRQKLADAKAAAVDNPRYATHVAELEKAQPQRVSILKASITLGADWIPTEIVGRWATEILQQRGIRVTYTPITSTWHLEEPNGVSAANATTWGVKNPNGNDVTGGDIIQESLNGRPAIVWNTWRDEHGTLKYARNDELTIDARSKQAQLKKEFAKWVRTTPDVAAPMEDLYNDRQNFATLPQYRAPSWQYYPGATNEITLRDDQKTAVTRGLKQSLGLFHAPGNGKTYIMTTIGMEARRLGIAKKVMIVVHNSTAEQFPSMAQELYPSAKIMFTGQGDFDPQHRKSTMARIATGDWDLVIIPQSQYNMIKVDPVRVDRWIEDQVDELERARIEMARVEGENSPQVRDIIRAQRRLRQSLDELAKIKGDDAYTFEKLGVDFLMIDEFHAYKKLAFHSNRPNIKGLDRTFSKRGLSNKLKMLWVQDLANGKNTIGATGTPISNTSAEAWNMMRYIRPDVLTEYGIENFDQFASTYGDTKSDIELTAGGTWKEDTRFTGYTNAQNLVKAWKETADVVTQDMVKLKNLPVIKGGGTKSIEVEQTPELTAAVRWIRSQLEGYAQSTGRTRYELKWIPGTMYTMGKKASIDMRLVDPSLPDNPRSKLNRAVEEIQRTYKEYEPVEGTTWVFLDMKKDETGKNATFNAHEEIKRKLIKGGIPANEIVIFDEKMKGARRAMVREQANIGKIRVLIGHSDTLGTGFDAPGHAVAIIHVDSPDTPAKMEQRTARVVRQNNRNLEVEVISLGVKDTLDAARYQMLVRKQAQLNQLMRGDYKGNYVEDPTDEMQLDFQQQLSAYSGNPLSYKRFKLENEVKTLESVQSAHAEQVNRSQRELLELRDHTIPFNERQLESAQKAAAEFAGVFEHGYTPVLQLSGDSYTGQEPVRAAIESWAKDILDKASQDALQKQSSIRRELNYWIKLNDKQIVADANVGVTWDYDPNGKRLPAQIGYAQILWRFKDGPNVYNGFSTGAGFLQNVPAQVEKIMREPQTQEIELATKQRNALELKNYIERPWEQTGELAQKREELQQTIAELQAGGSGVKPGDAVVFTHVLGEGDPIHGILQSIENGQASIAVTESDDWLQGHGVNQALEQGHIFTVPLENVTPGHRDPDFPLADHPQEQRQAVRAAIREALDISELGAKAKALRRSADAALEAGQLERFNDLQDRIKMLRGNE